MTHPVIQTPRGKVVVAADGKAELKWDTNFRPRWQRRYSAAQEYVDSDVLRLSEPYTPLLTGMLVKSGILGTDIGSGTVQWIAPYARRQYYSLRRPGSKSGRNRGPFWFQRMKEIYGSIILLKARKIAGGEGKAT